MLAADKLLLQSDVKQRSISLREKELKCARRLDAPGRCADPRARCACTSRVISHAARAHHDAARRLFNSNFSAVGTQAAIMAGFTLTSFVEIDLPPNRDFSKSLLHFFITLSICLNFVCVAMVLFVTVWGSGKVLEHATPDA